MKILSILLMAITCSLVLPLEASSAESDDKQNGDTSKQNSHDGLSFDESSSTTQVNIGQQISDFVHKFEETIKKQREESLAIIKECHSEIENASAADKQSIISKCQLEMKNIREKFQNDRKQFQSLFKDFRDSVIKLRQNEEISQSESNRQNAISEINQQTHARETAGTEIIKKINDLSGEAHVSQNPHLGINGTNMMSINHDKMPATLQSQGQTGHGKSDFQPHKKH